MHVLGDFYSVAYVALWARMLGKFAALHVWGYTARHPGTKIGDAIATLNAALPARWAVRFSGVAAANGALSNDQPEAAPMLASKTAFLCPEQTGKAASCGACGACWVATKAVVFVTH